MPYTHRSAENLVREGIERQRMYVTGNPIKEVLRPLRAARSTQPIPSPPTTWSPGSYFLVTAHRAETVDDPERLASLVEALNRVVNEYDMPALASLHPRTADKMKEFGVDAGRVTFVPPLGLFDFVRLEKEAHCVLSDSGTVQEECCIFGVPTVTMRDVTERPETIECGSNCSPGSKPTRIVPAVESRCALARQPGHRPRSTLRTTSRRSSRGSSGESVSARGLVVGASGMLGHEAVRVLAPDLEVWGACRRPQDLPALGVPQGRLLAGLDATNAATAYELVRRVQPDLVLNAVGIVKQLADSTVRFPRSPSTACGRMSLPMRASRAMRASFT